MRSSLKPHYHTTKVEEAGKKSERPMEYFTRENNIQRPSSLVKRSSESPHSTAIDKPPVSENKAAPPKKLERKQSEDINESAENFINKFKQQLLLQRLESIENYEEMLKRGT